MGARIRDFHKQIRGVRPDGKRYHALEPDAYAWVHATLAAGIVAAHERFGARLTERRSRAAVGRVAHARTPARDPRARPSAHWREFRTYFERIVEETLRRTAAVEEVLDALAKPRAAGALPRYRARCGRSPRAQLGHVVRLATAGLLPRDAARALRRSRGAAAGSSSCARSRERCAPPRR